MVDNGCLGCYSETKPSSPYSQEKPYNEACQSLDSSLRNQSSGFWGDVRSLPRRNLARGSRSGKLAWLNLMTTSGLGRATSRKTASRQSKSQVNEPEEAEKEDGGEEEEELNWECYAEVMGRQDQQRLRLQLNQLNTVFRQYCYEVTEENMQELQEFYQGMRFDFVDKILEAPLFTSTGTTDQSRPFIQSSNTKQVLLGKVEPLHLSQALRRRDHVFHCYEFFLLTRLETDPDLWNNLCQRFGYCEECRGVRGSSSCSDKQTDMFRVSAIKPDLWFLAVTIKDSKDKLIHFIRSEMPTRSMGQELSTFGGQSFLASYLSTFNFVELRLDNVLKPGTALPSEIFLCTNVKTLSLKNNFIKKISPDIGKLSQLKRLFLTHNQLDVKSIPFTLTFCRKLEEVYLDNNLLDALPCILLRLANLRRLHRHGNHNYFKDTFMFYHTDINDRILQIPGRGVQAKETKDNSLQNLAGSMVLSSRQNFFINPSIPQSMKKYLAALVDDKELCDACSCVLSPHADRFRVFTFKNPYLGNTCVPFQHTACSEECARQIEVPARIEQLSSARQQDWEYEQYIRESTLYLQDVGHLDSPGFLDSRSFGSSRRSSLGSGHLGGSRSSRAGRAGSWTSVVGAKGDELLSSATSRPTSSSIGRNCGIL